MSHRIETYAGDAVECVICGATCRAGLALMPTVPAATRLIVCHAHCPPLTADNVDTWQLAAARATREALRRDAQRRREVLLKQQEVAR